MDASSSSFLQTFVLKRPKKEETKLRVWSWILDGPQSRQRDLELPELQVKMFIYRWVLTPTDPDWNRPGPTDPDWNRPGPTDPDWNRPGVTGS